MIDDQYVNNELVEAEAHISWIFIQSQILVRIKK